MAAQQVAGLANKASEAAMQAQEAVNEVAGVIGSNRPNWMPAAPHRRWYQQPNCAPVAKPAPYDDHPHSLIRPRCKEPTPLAMVPSALLRLWAVARWASLSNIGADNALAR